MAFTHSLLSFRAGQGRAGQGRAGQGKNTPGACSDQMHCSIQSKLMARSMPMLMMVPALNNQGNGTQ